MNNEVEILALSAIALFACLAGFIIYFVVIYQKRQIQNRLEQENLKFTFKQELLKTQIEVQEETFNNVSQEIHDNISQVLSFIKLNLAFPARLTEPERQERITESRELISQTINDLRNLSKSLSFEHIAMLGLVKTIQNEVDRINKSDLIKLEYTVEGNSFRLGEQTELVMFRIFQETLNNTLKHAGAKQFKIGLQYSDRLFTLTLEDDGVGFSTDGRTEQNGSGLKNIQNRATLIGANAIINSLPGKGSSTTVSLNPRKQLSADGNHTYSAG